MKSKKKLGPSKRPLIVTTIKNNHEEHDVKMVGLVTKKEKHCDVILLEAKEGNLTVIFKSGLGLLKAEIEKQSKKKIEDAIVIKERRSLDEGQYICYVIEGCSAKRFRGECIPKQMVLTTSAVAKVVRKAQKAKKAPKK